MPKRTHSKNHRRSGLAGASAAMLIEKCSTIISKMRGNVNYPSPTPSLADLTAANEALSAAAIAASRGDRELILVRKGHQQIVANMLRNLAGYVTMTADGDGAILA